MNNEKLYDQVEGVVEVKEDKSGSVLILRFSGRLDALSTPDVEKRVFHLVEQGQANILMDFASVDYISSAGMRMLLAVTKKLKVLSGKLILCSISTNVMDVFKMSGFDHVLDLSSSEQEALKKF